jgi:hypothetical protein
MPLKPDAWATRRVHDEGPTKLEDGDLRRAVSGLGGNHI